ncbi:hypothetical protein SIM91_44550 [Rhodococcus opacus]|uniref:hypothetical protein n=1 Tax=Rhodococcus opacus TaxID=37919 RepID=UPI0007CD59FF|nr:hypothetical protein [Rhodococcus opacus]MDX5970209.1 hypothetical protein [Rhodococcus opacus]NKY75123.1 hypothetical protein [Rhodococcus opacus]CAG7632516.1 hypothetical protein E143388_07408 [Rhodococcus opacus]
MSVSNKLHPEQGTSSGGKDNHPIKVTIRTLAGHSASETVKPNDTVAEITASSVKRFVAKGELPAGDYMLALPRLGGEGELDPTARLRDVSVVDGDVLVLVDRKPQVDG